MKLKDIFQILIGVIVYILLYAFIDSIEKGKRKDEIIKKLRQENLMLKRGYLELFANYLRKSNSVEPNVIEELEKLKETIDELDTAVHIELESVIKRVNDDEGTKAIKDLAKIVENVLKRKASNDSTFKGKPMLNNLLLHAKKCNWINDRMFSNAQLLKDIRNKESHELAVKIPTHELGMALFGGIELIYYLNTPVLAN